MNLEFALQFNFGHAAQVLAQNFFLDLELMLVAGVLIMASAAAVEVWARWRDPMRGRLHNCFGVCACESGLLFCESRLDLFSGQHEGNEHSLSAATFFVAGWSGRKAGKSIAAINQLFNV